MDGTEDEDDHQIKVFSSDDEKLKVLGELLSNKSSRDIIRLLIENEMYQNEIANKLNLSPHLVTHHLKKLKDLDLLLIAEKKITKKGDSHKFFKIVPNIFLSLGISDDEIKENGTIKKYFKDGVKFATIITTGVVSWFTINFLTKPRDYIQSNATDKLFLETINDSVIIPTVISSITVILLTLLIIKKKK